MIKAALFDLDGTLADSLADIAESMNGALAERGYPGRPEANYKYLVGDGAAKLAERLLPDDKKTPGEIELLRGMWAERYAKHCLVKTRPYDGMAETLERLKRSGVRLCVVTNKSEELAKKIIHGLYGEDTFDIISGKHEGSPLKPDPYLAREAMRIFGADGSECVFTGDTAVDMKTAVNAGCAPVGALWGYRTAEELSGAGAKFLIEKPSELLAICF